jgi:hypothetical protein
LRETQASREVVDVTLLVAGAKAEAMLRAERMRAAEVFMVVNTVWNLLLVCVWVCSTTTLTT